MGRRKRIKSSLRQGLHAQKLYFARNRSPVDVLRCCIVQCSHYTKHDRPIHRQLQINFSATAKSHLFEKACMQRNGLVPKPSLGTVNKEPLRVGADPAIISAPTARLPPATPGWSCCVQMERTLFGEDSSVEEEEEDSSEDEQSGASANGEQQVGAKWSE